MKTMSALGAAAALILSAPSPIAAQDPVAQIIERCERDMGAYGAWMVKACVDQDIEAMRELAGYPEDSRPIIARCTKDMGGYGWWLVQACVDQDIEAAEALSRY